MYLKSKYNKHKLLVSLFHFSLTQLINASYTQTHTHLLTHSHIY